MCRRVEEHVVSVEARVSSLTPATGQFRPLLPPTILYIPYCPPEHWDRVLEEPLACLLSTLHATVSIFKKALFFLILKVSISSLVTRVDIVVYSQVGYYNSLRKHSSFINSMAKYSTAANVCEYSPSLTCPHSLPHIRKHTVYFKSEFLWV